MPMESVNVCSPILFAAASAGMQMYSGIQQARAIRAEGDAANNYYQYNAKISEQNALLAERTGRAQSTAIQNTQAIQGRQLKESNVEFRASQEAALAASGIPLSSVTAGDIQRSTVSKQALDEATLRFNSDTRSWEALTNAQNNAYSNRVQATGYRASGLQAQYASRVASRNTLIGGAFSAGASLLTPLSSAFSSTRGLTLGSGTTSYGITAPSRYIPRY